MVYCINKIMTKYQKTYVKFLREFVKFKKPLKVVFDCSNGISSLIIGQLKNKNLKTVLINAKPDGNFPAHGPNPLVKGAMNDLKKAVLKNRADLGVIFDGDGDRAFFVDNKGRFVDPDEVAYLLIWSLKPKKVVYDVRTGWLIRKLPITNYQLQITESKVGHYFIKKLMREKDIKFGCEQSGHYYFKKFFYADSGILAAIEVINAVSKLPYKFSDFIDLSPCYFRSGELNIGIMKYELGIMNKLLKKIENKYKRQSVKISHLDGLSMEFDGWRFNLRPSNTEPLARLNVEATNKKTLAKQTKILLGLLRK